MPTPRSTYRPIEVLQRRIVLVLSSTRRLVTVRAAVSADGGGSLTGAEDPDVLELGVEVDHLGVWGGWGAEAWDLGGGTAPCRCEHYPFTLCAEEEAR